MAADVEMADITEVLAEMADIEVLPVRSENSCGEYVADWMAETGIRLAASEPFFPLCLQIRLYFFYIVNRDISSIERK